MGVDRRAGVTVGEGMRTSAENKTRCRHAGTGGDEHMLDIIDLVDRRSAQLPHTLGNAIHPMDISLTELATVSVDRQPPADFDRAA